LEPDYYEYNKDGDLVPCFGKAFGKFVLRDGKLVRISENPVPPMHYAGNDSMKATKNPVNGKIYESRSAYEAAVRNAGCRIVGNDLPAPTKEVRGDFNIQKEFREAVQKVLN